MFGFGSSPVSEHEATGEIERVYHEICQTLRVSGVNLNFRTWAGYENLLPVLWDGLRPNCETRGFEGFADALRAHAAQAALSFSRIDADESIRLGKSQAFQLKKSLQLYHFVNPKLLLFTSAVRLALRGELPSPPSATANDPVPLIPRGIPGDMYPMVMLEEEPGDPNTRSVFDDIKNTLKLKSINSDYRTLALWPNYLQVMWAGLKPIVQTAEYQGAADQLREHSRSLAMQLPRAVSLTIDDVKAANADPDKAIETSEAFERLLPGLIINIAICLRDYVTDGDLPSSPWPAEAAVALAVP